MYKEIIEAKRYFGFRFGIYEFVPDGVYAIPTITRRGKAFMECQFKNNDFCATASPNFVLYWDEKLTISWYEYKRPWFLRESKFARRYRKLLKVVDSINS